MEKRMSKPPIDPSEGMMRIQYYASGEWLTIAPTGGPPDKVDVSSISDGYHTFDELYEHRNLLFLNLCIATQFPIWWKFDPDAKGYFILYLDTDDFGQISYHLPLRYLHFVERYCLHQVEARDWDGHTSKDVVDRLFQCVQNGGLLIDEGED